MAYFENYEEDKAFWFLTYLQLAEVISHYPTLSAKNSNFQDEVDKYLGRHHSIRREHGNTNGKKQKGVGL